MPGEHFLLQAITRHQLLKAVLDRGQSLSDGKGVWSSDTNNGRGTTNRACSSRGGEQCTFRPNWHVSEADKIIFFSSFRALETQPSTMLRWQEQNTCQLMCCELKCPSADRSPTSSSSHPAPLSQGCIMKVEKKRNSSFSSFLKPRDTTIPRSQSSRPKINTASNPSTSHISGENRDANKPVSLQALLLPEKSHSI